MEIRDLGEFTRYWEQVRGRTLAVARCIPPEHIEWSNAPGRFTFGGLLRHLAGAERYVFVETAAGGVLRYPGHGPELASGLQDILAYMDRLHRESVALVSAMSDDDLQRRVSLPDQQPFRAWKWLRGMIEHEVHHRGQLYMYLALLGVPAPPIFGLRVEQVEQISAAASVTS